MSTDSRTAAETTAAIRSMGQVFNEQILNAAYALFKPLQERAPKDRVTVHKDLAYGDAAQRRAACRTGPMRPAHSLVSRAARAQPPVPGNADQLGG